MVLNFHSSAHQRTFFNNQCVDNGDVRTSCCYAMVLPTDVKAFFWAVSACMARAASQLRLSIRDFPIRRGNSATSRRNGERQRIGESIYGLEESHKGRSFDGQCSDSLHVSRLLLTVNNYSLLMYPL